MESADRTSTSRRAFARSFDAVVGMYRMQREGGHPFRGDVLLPGVPKARNNDRAKEEIL